MNSTEFVEYFVFFLIVISQVYFFNKTRIKINQFKFSVPESSKVSIADFSFTNEELEKFVSGTSPLQGTNEDMEQHPLFSNENLDLQSSSNVFGGNSHRTKLVVCNDSESPIFRNILSSLNKYLVRNRHSVPDFNLVKDIVERNTDSIEEEVNLTLSTPLYLGLMGTMLGIVIGLFSMSHLFNNVGDVSDLSGAILSHAERSTIEDKSFSDGIGILLGSVKIAMIASFLGLALTIYNSAILFKGTKYEIEAKKNAFYSFIQVELLPSLNQGIGATFESLQRNLSRFNEKFDSNLDKLSSVFDKNYESILLQKQLLEQMDRSKVSEMTRYNVQVLRELNVSVEQFEKFNVTFHNLNSFLSNSYQLTEKTNELLARTDNFGKIAEGISNTLSESRQLTKFLTTHFADLEDHKRKVNEAVVNISFNVRDTFDELQKSLQLSSTELSTEATLRSVEHAKVFDAFSKELKSSFEKQRDILLESLEEKKSNLDHLKHLETLVTEIKTFRVPSNVSGSSEKLYAQLVELTAVMSSSNRVLTRIEENARKPFYKKIFKKSSNEKG